MHRHRTTAATPRGGRPRVPRAFAAALACLALVHALAACSSGYAGRIRSVRDSLDRADPRAALEAIDVLVAASPTDDEDLPLLLLERGAILQALGEHEAAAADFVQADPMLEVLDLTSEGAEGLAIYLWSDDAGLYRPPRYEKLMVNVLALLSFLAADLPVEAAVEARRLAVLVDYYDDSGASDADGAGPMVGAASYLAGLASERAGRLEDAARFYLDAWAWGPAEGLAEALVRTTHGTTLAGRPEVAEARAALGLADDEAPVARSGVVVVALTGRAPRREAVRFPIGLVLGWVPKSYHYDDDQRSVLGRISAEDAATWVNFPVLEAVPNQTWDVDVTVDGRPVDLTLLADVESFALAQWEADRGGIAAAAIVRTIARVLAREAVSAAGSGSDEARVVGLLLQLGMNAADTPDTRSWNALPARIAIRWVPTPPGPTEVVLRAHGREVRERVDVPDAGWPVVVGRFF
jgi:hypothetical protein